VAFVAFVLDAGSAFTERYANVYLYRGITNGGPGNIDIIARVLSSIDYLGSRLEHAFL
jgi:hypothetical protein